MVSSLMIFTLFAALGVGIVLWLWHMRKPENRHPMADQPDRNIKEVANEREQDMSTLERRDP